MERSQNPFTDSGTEGVETSLSLGTSSSLVSQAKILKTSQKYENKNSTYCSHGNPSKTEQPNPVQVPVRPIFPYDLNDIPPSTRNTVSEIPSDQDASLNMLYCGGCPNTFSDALLEKDGKDIYAMSGDARMRCISGYTPTVAMARSATLARFLEKRLHRLNKARTSHLMGKPLKHSNSEGTSSSTAGTRSDKKGFVEFYF